MSHPNEPRNVTPLTLADCGRIPPRIAEEFPVHADEQGHSEELQDGLAAG